MDLKRGAHGHSAIEAQNQALRLKLSALSAASNKERAILQMKIEQLAEYIKDCRLQEDMWRKARNASEKQLATSAAAKSKTVSYPVLATEQSAGVERRKALRDSLLAEI